MKIITKIFNIFFSALILISFNFFSIPVPTQKVYASSFIVSNPHENYTYNYKGNIHAHSTNSDGADTPTVVGEWYRDNGYDFYTITDHNFLTPDPAVSGILWLGKSEEGSLTGNTAHMGNLNISTVIPNSDAQTMISNTLSQGGQTVLHHIDRSDRRWTAETIEGLTDVLGVEIYNGGGLNSTGTWDTVLTSGKNVWGTAADDSHNISGKGSAYIVVNSDNASPTNTEIMAQMAAGNFYASRGFSLSVTNTANSISVTSSGNKVRWIKRNGEVLKTTNASSDTLNLNGDEGYVRVEVLDSSDVPKAWSQPIIIVDNNKYSLYRFWSNNYKAHFYTASLNEKNLIESTMPEWHYEGTENNVYNNYSSYGTLVYRFWSNTYKHHFYTISESEKDNIIANMPEWQYEGMAYQAFAVNDPGTVPLYRFWSDTYKGHFYTSSESEKNNIITTMLEWHYEGVGYYVAL